jgi:hypothetical protein
MIGASMKADRANVTSIAERRDHARNATTTRETGNITADQRGTARAASTATVRMQIAGRCAHRTFGAHQRADKAKQIRTDTIAMYATLCGKESSIP